MAMPEYPPYTYVQDGKYQGEGYEAFAIYISKTFLAAEPDFMVELNKAIAVYHATKTTPPQNYPTVLPKNEVNVLL